MAIQPKDFDEKVPDWLAWGDTPWGQLYYCILRANLEKHIARCLPDGEAAHPLRILDVGGGYGADTLYFAAQGHRVTMLDYSPAMLAEARLRAERQGLADRINFIEMNVDHLAVGAAGVPTVAGAPFDVALCHLMVHFTPRPHTVLLSILQLLAPGGLLSLVDTNRYSEVYRRALQPDRSDNVAADYTSGLACAGEAVGMMAYPHPWFNRKTPIFSAEEMIALLESGGSVLAGQYGIRCVCDYLPNEPKFDPKAYAQLERLERRLSGEYPYYLLARFYQVIVRKSNA